MYTNLSQLIRPQDGLKKLHELRERYRADGRI